MKTLTKTGWRHNDFVLVVPHFAQLAIGSRLCLPTVTYNKSHMANVPVKAIVPIAPPASGCSEKCHLGADTR